MSATCFCHNFSLSWQHCLIKDVFQLHIKCSVLDHQCRLSECLVNMGVLKSLSVALNVWPTLVFRVVRNVFLYSNMSKQWRWFPIINQTSRDWLRYYILGDKQLNLWKSCMVLSEFVVKSLVNVWTVDIAFRVVVIWSMFSRVADKQIWCVHDSRFPLMEHGLQTTTNVALITGEYFLNLTWDQGLFY